MSREIAITAAAPETALTPRTLTPRDLGRVRRGEVDAQTLASLLYQTRALTPPDPPADGELGPNETGWLVAVGSPSERLYPRGMTWATKAGLLVAFGPTVQRLLGLPEYLVVAIAIGVTPMLLLWGGFRLVAARRLRHDWDSARPVERLADVPTGTAIRITGVVSGEHSFPALFNGTPSVLCSSRLGAAEEMRAIDFGLELANGDRVRVSARNVHLLDRPQPTSQTPACGPVSYEGVTRTAPARLRSDLLSPPPWWQRLLPLRRRESSIGPGDQVEIAGILHREPAPDGQAGPGRPTPMRHDLRGDEDTPLLIRKR